MSLANRWWILVILLGAGWAFTGSLPAEEKKDEPAQELPDIPPVEIAIREAAGPPTPAPETPPEPPPEPLPLDPAIHFEEVTLDEEDPPAHVMLLYRDAPLKRRPVILMLGSLDPHAPPDWSRDLLREGYMLAAFQVDHPPDPDPERRPEWLHFDQRFAHGYVSGGARAPHDAGRVMDYLNTRKDVLTNRFGWLGSSSSGIPGLAVATREPRLAAIVAFVSTGAYEQWLASWHTNNLWIGKTPGLWSETRSLLEYDPIHHVSTMFPCAVLMVSGGADKIVDPATARSFVDAARPFYKDDPERLRLVLYDGMGHNLPRDVVKMYAENWFHLYLHPIMPPPLPPPAPADLNESVRRTQINSASHRDLVGSESHSPAAPAPRSGSSPPGR